MDVEVFDDCKAASRAAAKRISGSLRQNASKNNLFMVSGGSSAKVAYWVSSELDINTTNSVTLAQVDERYGEVGHGDSNWKQLSETGLDASLFSREIEMLKLGVSAEDIASEYAKQLQSVIDDSEHKVALLGMGADGHIAGILPREEADFSALFLGEPLVISYDGGDFQRITITARALLQMDEIIVYACGQSKKEAIAGLENSHEPHEFPAEILKKCNNVSIFYSEGEK